jgi:DNA-directed RNA polymerase specialized sigma24 family protein
MLKQLTPDQVQNVIAAALRARDAARRFWSGKPLPFGDVAEALPAHDFTDADTAPLAHAEEVVAFRRLLAELSHEARAELMALAWPGLAAASVTYRTGSKLSEELANCRTSTSSRCWPPQARCPSIWVGD